MPQVGFKYCALQYLNTWLLGDYHRHKEMEQGTEDEQLTAISKFAYSYRIARNLPSKFDVGQGQMRYEPILRILKSTNKSDFQNGGCVSSTFKVATRISKQYGGKKVLS